MPFYIAICCCVLELVPHTKAQISAINEHVRTIFHENLILSPANWLLKPSQACGVVKGNCKLQQRPGQS